jgi:hypothetical protein
MAVAWALQVSERPMPGEREMKQFKIKDLLVQVVPTTDHNVGAVPVADECGAACSLNLSDITKYCCGGGCSTKPSGVCFGPSMLTIVRAVEINPAELAVLRAQLEFALREVEVRERLAEERLTVKTEAEADLLHEKLCAALEHLKTIKEDLSGK